MVVLTAKFARRGSTRERSQGSGFWKRLFYYRRVSLANFYERDVHLRGDVCAHWRQLRIRSLISLVFTSNKGNGAGAGIAMAFFLGSNLSREGRGG